MIENVVIGKPLVDEHHLLGINSADQSWQDLTMYTNIRFLPQILKELKLVPSASWVRKNRPDLYIELNQLDFIKIQISKKKKPIWIVVGE